MMRPSSCACAHALMAASCMQPPPPLDNGRRQEIVRLANHFVLKLPVKPGTELVLPKGSADPQLLLDYRCYLPGGSETMGNSYDKDIAQCLKKITDMTPKQVQNVWGSILEGGKESRWTYRRSDALARVRVDVELVFPTLKGLRLLLDAGAGVLRLPGRSSRHQPAHTGHWCVWRAWAGRGGRASKRAIREHVPSNVVQCYVSAVSQHVTCPSAALADMLTHGFEWAAKYGAPQNAVPKRYRLQPKCCKLAVKGWQTKCGHTWEPVWELPKGNPITGREWDKDRPDTGSYEGGTFPEDSKLGRDGTARGWSGA